MGGSFFVSQESAPYEKTLRKSRTAAEKNHVPKATCRTGKILQSMIPFVLPVISIWRSFACGHWECSSFAKLHIIISIRKVVA